MDKSTELKVKYSENRSAYYQHVAHFRALKAGIENAELEMEKHIQYMLSLDREEKEIMTELMKFKKKA